MCLSARAFACASLRVPLHVPLCACLCMCLSARAFACASLSALAHSQTRRAEHTIESERRRLADEKKSLEEALRTAQRELGQVCISLQVLIAS